AAARAEARLALASNSAYRSYATQVGLYDPSNPLIAPPGTSEHQTGLAMDIGAESGTCSLNVCFATTPEGRWLAANAWRFGFVLRFPDGMEGITGYPFEPWHYRYVGTELAAELNATGVRTLEEFFGLPPAPAPQ
ncbi:MAG TPA: M15 family metallopeptidase, partial [Naasia sp.]